MQIEPDRTEGLSFASDDERRVRGGDGSVLSIKVKPSEAKSPFGVAGVDTPATDPRWEMKQLNDVAEIDPENLSSDTDPDFEFNYISLEQVDAGQLLDSTRIVFRAAPTRARRVLRENDVLLSTVRPNRMAHLFFRGQVENAVCSTGFAVIRSKSCVSDPGYLFAQLFGHIVNKQINRMIAGSNYPAINSSDVGTIEIPCPPTVDEQRAIAEALSDVDGLIESLEALIAKKRAVKTAAMQQLLTGRTRLPRFKGTWETKRVGDVATVRDQKVLPSCVEPSTLCVELDHIEQDGGRLTHHSSAESSTSTKYCFVAGDVLFGRLRSYLRKFWYADRSGICTTEIWPLVVNTKQMDSRFLYLQVQTERFMEAASISYGTHMPRADWEVVRNLEISLPSLGEQGSIAEVFTDMDAEIVALERRLAKVRALKQGAMQQLLTGRIRLPASDAPARPSGERGAEPVGAVPRGGGET